MEVVSGGCVIQEDYKIICEFVPKYQFGTECTLAQSWLRIKNFQRTKINVRNVINLADELACKIKHYRVINCSLSDQLCLVTNKHAVSSIS